MILVHVHIEGFSEADPLTILNRLLNPTIILLICVLQWQVFLFKNMFSSSEITVEAWLLKSIISANIALINHF